MTALWRAMEGAMVEMDRKVFKLPPALRRTKRSIQLPPVVADGDLIATGERLEKMAADLAAARAWLDEVLEIFEAEVWRQGNWPADQRQWTRADAESYVAARSHVERNTEVGATFVRALETEGACYNRIDPLCNSIRAMRAHTPTGRAIKKRAIKIQSGAETSPARN
jgi:hypothetical protein